MDDRTPLAEGAALPLGGRIYHIEKSIGCGATSFVYAAWYDDSLGGGKAHKALIKELFPYHPKNLITRDEKGEIVCPREAEKYFSLRKRSFIRGNQVHIDLQNARADMAGVNIDSYEARGSVYTVLGNSSGETLQSVLRDGKVKITLPVVLHWMQYLLDALEVFHQKRLLHLDVSPDNILLLPLDDEKPERQRRILLIDYNSVWDMDELPESDGAYFSVKESYTAPEVRLKQQRAISPASDLFSVCAVLWELLQGKALDYSVLYTGGQILDVEAGLLKNAAPPVKAKIAEILRQGLKMPPKRRYQTIGELRRAFNELENLVSGEDIFKRSIRFFQKRAVLAAVITLALAFSLTFAAVKINERLSGYPITAQEKYVTGSAMAALAASLGKLGGQIDNDISALKAYDGGYDSFLRAAGENEPINGALTLKQPYTEESLQAFKAGASPIRFDLLLELLNAPNDYRTWADAMLAGLRSVLSGERYPPRDREIIVGLYREYIGAYTAVCYAKTQLVVLPLNQDGRKELLSALPYAPVFGERFMSQPFGGGAAELEGALTAAKSRLKDVAAELKSYGVDLP